MQACQPITAEADHTADTPLQTERSKQRLKSGREKHLLFLNYDYF